jgi:hypothetical protein
MTPKRYIHPDWGTLFIAKKSGRHGCYFLNTNTLPTGFIDLKELRDYDTFENAQKALDSYAMKHRLELATNMGADYE